ncbi:Uncharacterised protein [Vibrio cholerae]|nr:Uncharacterised protein [Vibrio cholerae]
MPIKWIAFTRRISGTIARIWARSWVCLIVIILFSLFGNGDDRLRHHLVSI